MTRRLSVVLVIITMLLAACAGGPDTPRGSVPSVDSLVAMFLSVEDLGDGWTAVGQGTSPVEPSRPEMLCPDGALLTLLDADTVSTASFNRRSPGGARVEDVFLVEELSAVAPDEAERFMSDVQRAVADCIGARWTSRDGEAVAFEMRSVPDRGDDAVGYRMVVEMASTGSRELIDIAVVQVETVVMRLVVATVDDPAAPRSVEFESVVAKAVDNISDVVN